MYKKHMRQPHRFDNKSTIDETACLKALAALGRKEAQKCNALCRLPPCYEEDIKMSLDYHKGRFPNYLELAFTFQSFLVEIVEEVPAYTWQELFANFGGCVGLMTGASILSLFELCIFFGLVVFDFFDIYTKVTSNIFPRQNDE